MRNLKPTLKRSKKHTTKLLSNLNFELGITYIGAFLKANEVRLIGVN